MPTWPRLAGALQVNQNSEPRSLGHVCNNVTSLYEHMIASFIKYFGRQHTNDNLQTAVSHAPLINSNSGFRRFYEYVAQIIIWCQGQGGGGGGGGGGDGEGGVVFSNNNIIE